MQPGMQPSEEDQPSWLKVVDPLAGTYFVPWSLIHQTSGSTSVCIKPRDISVCLLYQKGRCNADVRCHQVHADTNFVASMRALHKFNNTCCPAHGDCLSNLDGLMNPILQPDFGIFLYGKRTTNKSIQIPNENIGRTIFLEKLLHTQQPIRSLHIPVDKVCGLHQQSKCLYSHGCRNLHICRNLWAELVAQNPWLSKEIRNPKHSKAQDKPPAAPRDQRKPSHSPTERQADDRAPTAPLSAPDAPSPPEAAPQLHFPESPHQSQRKKWPAPGNAPGKQADKGKKAFGQMSPMLGSDDLLDDENDALSDCISSVFESFDQGDETSDAACDIMGVPTNLMERLHQLIEKSAKPSTPWAPAATETMKLPTASKPPTTPSSAPAFSAYAAPGKKQYAAPPANPWGLGPISTPPPPPAPPAKPKPAASPLVPLGTTSMPVHSMAHPAAPSLAVPPPPPPALNPPVHPMQAPLVLLQPPYFVNLPPNGTTPIPPPTGGHMALGPHAQQSAGQMAPGPMPISLMPPAGPSAPLYMQPPLVGLQGNAMGGAVAPAAPAAPSAPLPSAAPAAPPAAASTRAESSQDGADAPKVMNTMWNLTKSGFFAKLQELIQWKEQGLLSEEEFATVKAMVLTEHQRP